MKASEKIVRRLYAMGVISSLTPIVHSYHGSRNGSFSWVVSSGAHDVGSNESMKECLSWERWCYSPYLHEIFPYYEGKTTLLSGDVVEDTKVKSEIKESYESKNKRF